MIYTQLSVVRSQLSVVVKEPRTTPNCQSPVVGCPLNQKATGNGQPTTDIERLRSIWRRVRELHPSMWI
jgi:hypothetical protein